MKEKIELALKKRNPATLGRVSFASGLILAPLSGITDPAFRLLMEELGAGGTISELISCHGINYENKQTMEIMKIHPREQNVGIQLFGEEPETMASAAQKAEELKPKFIDINMGCPMKKVISKGAGSALLASPKKVEAIICAVKKSISLPLTIKIRMGIDQNNINADEIVKIAKDSGVEFVTLHGRTRSMMYTGHADWDYIENVASGTDLPIIGNGDISTPQIAREKLSNTKCKALMIGRGATKNPFIFLSALAPELTFTGEDYLEISGRYIKYLQEISNYERGILIQTKKMLVSFSTGMNKATSFRRQVFETATLGELTQLSQGYFLENLAS